MAKNAYLAKQRALQNELFKEGFDHGLQWGFDMAIIAMHREFGIGENRAKRFRDRLQEAQDEFHDAVLANDETDVKRELLDRELRSIYGDLEYDFNERYPGAKRYDYTRRVGDK